MPARIFDGKALSEKLIADCRQKTAELKPTLAVILVGDNPASQVYVRNKKLACERAGIRSVSLEYPASITEAELLSKIAELNADPAISGFIVQLPLPDHIREPLVIRAIDPKKDVDGFHAYNLGKMFLSKDFEDLPPATPAGIIRLLDEYGIDPAGREAVVIGRSNIVGKPIAVMLLNRSATVTVCHSKTPDLAAHTRRADILVVAIGRANFVSGEMVKNGAVVIDVGMNRLPDGKLVGDVDFASVKKKASLITPVPGGVGPMTIASLLLNTIRAAERQNGESPLH
jgi:methylenetetrahydrofolate dehydrogenase (NADP+)/methenyltetrahydrofolate cyclohydrolase